MTDEVAHARDVVMSGSRDFTVAEDQVEWLRIKFKKGQRSHAWLLDGREDRTAACGRLASAEEELLPPRGHKQCAACVQRVRVKPDRTDIVVTPDGRVVGG